MTLFDKNDVITIHSTGEQSTSGAFLWYLAHPYSGNVTANFESANAIAAKLFARHVVFYSPISMTHPIHEKGLTLKLFKGAEWEKWLQFDYVMMQKCNGLLLCPGWKRSKGCLRELDVFKTDLKPVMFVDHDGNTLYHDPEGDL